MKLGPKGIRVRELYELIEKENMTNTRLESKAVVQELKRQKLIVIKPSSRGVRTIYPNCSLAVLENFMSCEEFFRVDMLNLIN